MPLYVTPTPTSLEITDAGDEVNWTVNARHAGGMYSQFGVLYLFREGNDVLLAAVNPGGNTSKLRAGDRVYAYAIEPKSTPGVPAAQISGKSATAIVPNLVVTVPEENSEALPNVRGFVRVGRRGWVRSGKNRR